MKHRIVKAAILLALVSLGITSCEKDDNSVINKKKLPDPIAIELRGSQDKMVKSNTQFATDLFDRVLKEELSKENGNFMISPFSLSMALAMTQNGANGDTKTEIMNTLGFEAYTNQEINEYYKNLASAFFKTDPSTKIAIANSIWTNKNVKIKDAFIATNKQFFNATAQSVDFANPETAELINKWSADNTNNLIDNVIDRTDSEALMYLLNALYFKGQWASKFDKKQTSDKPFYSYDGVSQNAEMMHQEEYFNYMEDETMQAVQLPYGNNSFSMIVMLPKDGKTISDVSSNLKSESVWQNINRDMKSEKVDLSLPKFKTRYNLTLNDILHQMGIKLAFQPFKADFSGMSDNSSFISFVKQFTYINTDEVGTEAAAVTVVGMLESAAPPTNKTIVFNANRPFVYAIQENSTKSILFMGIVQHVD